MLRPIPPPLISFSSIIGLFSDKPSTQDLRAREDLARTVSRVRDELVQNVGDSEKIVRILEAKLIDRAGLQNLYIISWTKGTKALNTCGNQNTSHQDLKRFKEGCRLSSTRKFRSRTIQLLLNCMHNAFVNGPVSVAGCVHENVEEVFLTI
ncbi:hypothetical protein DVH24_027174 [Malus domestica]|uniref:Uncharacterized protein n=1 Tax=Malus domestica TaxID=3750 RepID=A0A498IQ64_MALDO|nr:hypothetical protein DVH24_027174 [Malus domestica]